MSRTIDPFFSKRLVYRAVEDNSDDEEFIHLIQRDAEAQSGSSFSLLVPENKKASNKWREALLERTLMSAIVCLPASTAEEAAAPTPTPIGVVALKGISPGHEKNRVSYISIDVLDSWRGRGYGGEAIEWALGYGFQMAGLHRIGIETFSHNAGAMRLYEKLGFVREGCKREEIWFNGRWEDYITYGILEGEWRDKMTKEGRKWRE